MATRARTSGVNTDIDTDYYVDVNLQKFRIRLPNQDIAIEAGEDGAAGHRIIDLCKPRAYRITYDGAHSLIYIIVEGAHADKSTQPGSAQFLQAEIRALGTVGNVDCSGAIVSDETLV